jgi:DNA repair protein RadC
MFAGQEREQFRALLLAHGGDILGVVESFGSKDEVDFPARAIFGEALRHDAQAIIVAHNHPSGDPSPSQADLAVTRQFVSTARCLRIQAFDHLIFAQERFTSFRKDGLL